MRQKDSCLISVIVLVYNVEPYLREAVDSVLHQSYQNLEVILIDDGSTDGSGRICDLYGRKDRRVKVIHQPNLGLSAARNTGLDLCRGEMIAFLDPDDAYQRDMLRKMSDAMTTSGADIVECNFAVYHGMSFMNPRKIKLKKKGIRREGCTGLYHRQAALRMQVKGKIAPSAWNKLYQRNIWDGLRFRVGQNYEDLDVILPLLGKAEKVYIFDEPLVMHRRRLGSITMTLSCKNIKDLISASQHYRTYAQSHAPDAFTVIDIRRIYEDGYRLLLSMYYRWLCQTYPLTGTRNDRNRRDVPSFLKQEIADLRGEIDIRECDVRTKAGSWICFYMPPLVAAQIYRIYRPFRIISNAILSCNAPGE